MNWLNKNKTLLFAILSVILFILLLNQCQDNKERQNNNDSVIEYARDSTKYYKNKYGQEIAFRKTIQGTKENLEYLLSKQIDSTQQLKRLNDSFKKTLATANIIQETKIDTVYIPLDSLFNFKTNKKHYSLSGQVQKERVRIDQITIPNTLSFVIGKKKTGFFKNEIRIEAVNSNPLIKNIGLDSYIYKEPVKRFGIGFYVGYGLTQNFNFDPSFGISLNYNLIRF